jgi:hypothetical protein
MNTLPDACKDNVIDVDPDSASAKKNTSVVTIGANTDSGSLIMPQVVAEDNSVPIAGHGFKITDPLSHATVEGVLVEYKDSRPGVTPHRAYVFRVEPSKGTVYDEIKELLGQEKADQLVKDWGDKCNLRQKLQVAMDVAIFLDSNDKDRDTQGEDFANAGTSFSNDLALTLLCARKLRKARAGNTLSAEEMDLKKKQEVGFIRSCSGALGIDVCGHLRVLSFFGDGHGHQCEWASCSSPSRN